MRLWLVLVLALAACDQVFSLDRPPIDALVIDAAPDGPPDAAIDAPPPCTPPSGSPTIGALIGTYNDFSPNEDETLALVTRAGFTLEYTENGSAPFGTSVASTGVSGMWGRVVLSPDGNLAFLSNASAKIFMSMRSGGPGTWLPPVESGLPDGLPGRPSADNARILIEYGGGLQEYERSGTVWSAVGPHYTAPTLGHVTGQLTYASLSADGRFLVYVIPNVGTFLRVRDSGGTFGTVGSMLTSGDVRFPVLVKCRRLYGVQTQGFPFVYVYPP